jgi:hypothetical protein
LSELRENLYDSSFKVAHRSKGFLFERCIHSWPELNVNAPTIGAEIQLPFGSTKGTGNGHREAGTAAIDFYSEWKTLYVDYSDRLQRAQIDAADLA